MLSLPLYSWRLSEYSLFVRLAGTSPGESPIVSRRASRAKQQATWRQSRPAHFPTAKPAPPAKCFLRTPAWFSSGRRCPLFAGPPPPLVRKERDPDSRWQSSRRSDPATHSILALLHQPWHWRASKSQFALPRIHRASRAPQVPQPPAFSDTRCRRKKTDRRELHSAFAKRNSRWTRKSHAL